MNITTEKIDMSGVAERAALLLKDGDVLGLGSGSAVTKFAFSLGKRVKSENISITVVPSSLQAAILAKQNGLILSGDSANCPVSLDIAVDGADQVAVETGSMIKGGGGQLLKEKIVLSSAKRRYILVDRSKIVKNLLRPVPVEVFPFSLDCVRNSLKEKLHSIASLRKLEKDYPYYTENGNLILDTDFGEIKDPSSLEAAVKCVPGVAEVGIFNVKVDAFLVGNQDGSVEELVA